MRYKQKNTYVKVLFFLFILAALPFTTACTQQASRADKHQTALVTPAPAQKQARTLHLPHHPIPSQPTPRTTVSPTSTASPLPGTGTITPAPPLRVPGPTVNVGNGSPASCTETALDQAVQNVVANNGGNIVFQCGPNPVTIPITTQKTFSATVNGSAYAIDGGGQVTLDAGHRTRIFFVSDAFLISFTVQNLIIINGYTTGQGAGLYSGYKKNLTVQNCRFDGNISTSGGPFDGGGAIFIASEGSATITNSSFNNNRANNGGAINNLISTLHITNSIFTGNSALVSGSGGGGGAIYSDSGILTIANSVLSGNSAIFQGGGVFSYNGPDATHTTTITQTTVANNQVTGTGNQGFGGGIYNGRGPLTILSSTITGNRSSNQGGGLWNGDNAVITIANSTIYGNYAAGLGGGIMRTSGIITLMNSTLAANMVGSTGQGAAILGDASVTLKNTIITGTTPGKNCYTPLTDGGNNLQYPDTSCASSIPAKDPLLGPPDNNGGPTQTLLPQNGSPALDSGNINVCAAAPVNSQDQRGVSRPRGNGCDIGALER